MKLSGVSGRAAAAGIGIVAVMAMATATAGAEPPPARWRATETVANVVLTGVNDAGLASGIGLLPGTADLSTAYVQSPGGTPRPIVAPGGGATVVVGLKGPNGLGELAVSELVDEGVYRSWIWRDGTYDDRGLSSEGSYFLTAVNNDGDATFITNPPGCATCGVPGVVDRNGVRRYLETPAGATSAWTYDLNASGVAVGSFHPDVFHEWPLRWAPDGAATQLPLPADALGGYAIAINDAGDAIGAFNTADFPYGGTVVWPRSGGLVDLRAGNAYNRDAISIAEDGSVLVFWTDADNHGHNGIWRDGKLAELTIADAPRYPWSAYGISPNGQHIVGTGAPTPDTFAAVRLEPAATVLDAAVKLRDTRARIGMSAPPGLPLPWVGLTVSPLDALNGGAVDLVT